MKCSKMLLQQFDTFLFKGSLALARSSESMFWENECKK